VCVQPRTNEPISCKIMTVPAVFFQMDVPSQGVIHRACHLIWQCAHQLQHYDNFFELLRHGGQLLNQWNRFSSNSKRMPNLHRKEDILCVISGLLEEVVLEPTVVRVILFFIPGQNMTPTNGFLTHDPRATNVLKFSVSPNWRYLLSLDGRQYQSTRLPQG